jgi:hypothetical protein
LETVRNFIDIKTEGTGGQQGILPKGQILESTCTRKSVYIYYSSMVELINIYCIVWVGEECSGGLSFPAVASHELE